MFMQCSKSVLLLCPQHLLELYIGIKLVLYHHLVCVCMCVCEYVCVRFTGSLYHKQQAIHKVKLL